MAIWKLIIDTFSSKHLHQASPCGMQAPSMQTGNGGRGPVVSSERGRGRAEMGLVSQSLPGADQLCTELLAVISEYIGQPCEVRTPDIFRHQTSPDSWVVMAC